MKKISVLAAVLLFNFLIASAQEWRQLFNGNDLEGWQMVGPGKFIIQDSLMKTSGGMGLLVYAKQKFENAVIKIVYRPQDNDANSGVFIRLPEMPKDPWDAVNTGYEVQIDGGLRYFHDYYHSTGCLYSLTKALAFPQKAPHEWNTMEITLNGGRTIVHVNGEKVTDYREGDPVPKERRWFEPKRGPRPNAGYIGLQNHDPESIVLYKEISVRILKK